MTRSLVRFQYGAKAFCRFQLRNHLIVLIVADVEYFGLLVGFMISILILGRIGFGFRVCGVLIGLRVSDASHPLRSFGRKFTLWKFRQYKHQRMKTTCT